jgi:hypothetical protein
MEQQVNTYDSHGAKTFITIIDASGMEALRSEEERVDRMF